MKIVCREIPIVSFKINLLISLLIKAGMLRVSVLIFGFFIASCAGMNPRDLMNKKPLCTKFIVDKRQIYTDSTNLEVRKKYWTYGPIIPLDTFVILKPIISVSRVKNDDWFLKPELLDADIQDFWFENDVQTKYYYEFDWYSFIHKFMYILKPHYLPLISENDNKIIERQVHKMEAALDTAKLNELTLNDSLYDVLKKYPGHYYMLHSLKERYWQGVHFNIKSKNNFLRMRVFVFNSQTKKAMYYNREYVAFGWGPYWVSCRIITIN